jgi:hypothetical protein
MREIAVEASSLFDAADRALEQWSRLWWYCPGAVVEVRIAANAGKSGRSAQRMAW